MTSSVQVQCRNMHIGDDLRTHVEQRAGNLDRYLSSLMDVSVELSHHKGARDAGDRNVAQVTVRGKGITLRAEERASDAQVAFDSAIDVLRSRIERYKGRHGNRAPGAATVSEGLASVAEPAEVGAGISRRKKFQVHPMSEAEAMEQMSMLGHNAFFVFLNMESNRLCVIYRRRDGSLGLLEPELA